MTVLDLWVILVASVLYYYLSRKKRLPLAPGPKGYPIIGNLFDIPKKHPHLEYAAWVKKYNSDILNLNVLGSNIVIVNSARVADDLFDKRSAIYSSRPHFPMVADLMGWGFLMSIMPYNAEWRRRRRLFQRFFPPSRASVIQPQQRTYVRRLLPQLVDPEQDWASALRHFTGGIAITLAYGIDVKPVDDPYVNISESAIGILNRACAPGAYLVDTIPWLKHIPDWFPGAKFKRDAKEWYKSAMEYREAPFQATKQSLESGTASPSYTATCLEYMTTCSTQEQLEREGDIKDTAAIFFGGGSDTTLAALLILVFALVTFPDVQAKAQEELDRVVGPDRLPDFADSPNLPYLHAVLREAFRWRPPAPLSIPRCTTEDDIYNGYFIPKGSIVFPNVWGMVQDPEIYPDPNKFNPERFLKKGRNGELELEPSVANPVDAVFGFGRRACPGVHMALSTLFLVTSCILHTMHLSRLRKDEAKVGVDPGWEPFTATLFPIPEPFECVIKPRSEAAERLIRDEAY